METSHPNAKGAEILANVEHFPVDIRIDGRTVEVFAWYVGGTWNASDGPEHSVLVVAGEPNPYSPPESEQYEKGVEPSVPNPSVSHVLTVWAIEELSSTRYRILDDMEIELPAPLLHYGALMTVTQDPWRCEVDPSLRSYVESNPAGTHRSELLFAFFDSTNIEELEIEEHYPAVLAFTLTNGNLANATPDHVKCILRFDPEDF